MSTTALMPLDPSVSPQQAARVLTIRANLLPRDISDGRRARRTRAVALVAVVLVLAGLGGWYWQAASQRQDAEKEFADVTLQIAAVQSQQNQYTQLTQVKNNNTVMSATLAKLMADDLSWQTLLDLMRTTGTATEAEISEVSGSLSQTTVAAGDTVGSLSISGTAPDKKAVAAYMKALGKLTKQGISDPFVSSVAGSTGGDVTFSMTVTITKTALCGRFSTKTCTSGGTS